MPRNDWRDPPEEPTAPSADDDPSNPEQRELGSSDKESAGDPQRLEVAIEVDEVPQTD